MKALTKIFDEVKKFITKEMKKIMKFTKEIKGFLDDIEDFAEDGAKKVANFFKVGRRLVHVDEEDGSEREITMDEAGAIAYKKGVDKFQELLGEHVQRVYRERNLAANAGNYIGFKSFEIEFSQDFKQTFFLDVTGRQGRGGDLFSQSVEQEKTFPLPLPIPILFIKGSGMMEISMPYSFTMAADVYAKFGYEMGEASLKIVSTLISSFSNV